LLATAGAEIGRRPERTPRRLEDSQRFISTQLEHHSTVCLGRTAGQLCECPGQPGGRVVTLLVGELV
jgi:hypothetical protein